MTSAKASRTAGFIAVSLAAVTSSSGAPARPLLKCNANAQRRVAANRASPRRFCWSLWRSEAGSHAVRQPLDSVCPSWRRRATPDRKGARGETARRRTGRTAYRTVQKRAEGRVLLLESADFFDSRDFARLEDR